MNQNRYLHNLLHHPPRLPRGRDALRYDHTPRVGTGFYTLDHLLPDGGWPRGQITELIVPQQGTDELRLILPALAKLGQEDARWLTWIAPPHFPEAPTLTAHNIPLARSLLIHPRAPADQLWALEQALRSGTCNAVMAWPPPSDIRTQRRLQLAAETGGAVVFFYYLEEQTPLDSFAALRLRVETNATTHKIHLKILKRRGARAGEDVDVALTHVMADYATLRKRGR